MGTGMPGQEEEERGCGHHKSGMNLLRRVS